MPGEKNGEESGINWVIRRRTKDTGQKIFKIGIRALDESDKISYLKQVLENYSHEHKVDNLTLSVYDIQLLGNI